MAGIRRSRLSFTELLGGHSPFVVLPGLHHAATASAAPPINHPTEAVLAM